MKTKTSNNCEIFLCKILNFKYRRWAGKTSYVHLAPEHEFTIKHKRRPE